MSSSDTLKCRAHKKALLDREAGEMPTKVLSPDNRTQSLHLQYFLKEVLRVEEEACGNLTAGRIYLSKFAGNLNPLMSASSGLPPNTVWQPTTRQLRRRLILIDVFGSEWEVPRHVSSTS